MLNYKYKSLFKKCDNRIHFKFVGNTTEWQQTSSDNNLTGKDATGSPEGGAATIAVPNAMRLRGWGDVLGSVAVSIGYGIAIKQMDEDAGDVSMLPGLGVTGLKAVK